MSKPELRKPGVILLGITALFCLGCQAVPHSAPFGEPFDESIPISMPRELSKVVMPEYIIEPPDILVIEGINMVPKAPYRLRTSDVLAVQVDGTLPDAPIEGAFAIEPGGLLNFGIPYGTVSVAGKTIDEVRTDIEEHLKQVLREPLVSISLLQLAGLQQISGEHLVTPDGTVNLGTYGKVSVVGKTIEDATTAIEEHLMDHLDEPEVAVDVFAYNSKNYFIVTEGAGTGDQITRLPITGNETVLDAISQIGGLTALSSKRIWVARPSPHNSDVQILPVDWVAITAQGLPATNYQLLPGDRIFVAEDKLVAADTRMAKLLAPVERAAGFSLLMVSTVTRFSGNVLAGGGDQRTGVGF